MQSESELKDYGHQPSWSRPATTNLLSVSIHKEMGRTSCLNPENFPNFNSDAKFFFSKITEVMHLARRITFSRM